MAPRLCVWVNDSQLRLELFSIQNKIYLRLTISCLSLGRTWYYTGPAEPTAIFWTKSCSTQWKELSVVYLPSVTAVIFRPKIIIHKC